MKNLIIEIQEQFNAALQAKTGWGRNEVIALFNNITIKVLSNDLLRSKVTVIEPRPEDKYDSIMFQDTPEKIESSIERRFDEERIEEQTQLMEEQFNPQQDV